MIERSIPPRDLADLVEEFSARRAIAARAAVPIFASARIEIVFHFADPFLVAGDTPAGARPLAPSAVLGPRDRLYWQLAGPRIDWFIIQLTPIGCRRLLGCRFADLWHGEAQLSLYWGAEADRLHDRLAAAAGFAERVAVASAALRDRALHPDGDVHISHLAVLARRGRLRGIDQLVGCSSIGARRLRQRFDAELGIGPKHFLNVMRFGRLLRNLHPRPWLGRGADEAEYADDSHAIRAFRRFAGTTPGRYRAAKAAGDELVYTGAAVPL